MNAPPSDPGAADRIASTVELYAKIAGGLAGLWVVLEKVAKPYLEWRRKHLASVIREELQPQLTAWQAVIDSEAGCANRLETICGEMSHLHQQMKDVYTDLDVFIQIASDNRERHDETAELLNAVFGLDRRIDHDKAEKIDHLLEQLRDRQRIRRRGTIADALPHSA